MGTARRTYRRLLATLALLIVCMVSFNVIMADHGESSEPFEFVPVQTN